MALLLTVSAPSPGSSAERADQLITGYRTHRHEALSGCVRAAPPDQPPRPDPAPPRHPDRAPASALVVLTASQSDCLRDMLAVAITYHGAAAGCPICQGIPAERCDEHSPAWSVIQAYRQLAANLGEVTGGDH